MYFSFKIWATLMSSAPRCWNGVSPGLTSSTTLGTWWLRQMPPRVERGSTSWARRTSPFAVKPLAQMTTQAMTMTGSFCDKRKHTIFNFFKGKIEFIQLSEPPSIFVSCLCNQHSYTSNLVNIYWLVNDKSFVFLTSCLPSSLVMQDVELSPIFLICTKKSIPLQH